MYKRQEVFESASAARLSTSIAEVISPYWAINTAETAPEINSAVAKKMYVDAPPSAIIIPHTTALAVLNPFVDIAIVS